MEIGKSGLNSPMNSGVSQKGHGGGQPGDRDGMKEMVAAGAPPSSTKGGPVGMQITEELKDQPTGGVFPSGSAIRTAGARR